MAASRVLTRRGRINRLLYDWGRFEQPEEMTLMTTVRAGLLQNRNADAE
jgi:hypothetical protein